MKKVGYFILALLPLGATLLINLIVGSVTAFIELTKYLKLVPNFTPMTVQTFLLSLQRNTDFLLFGTVIYQIAALVFFFIWYKFIAKEKIEWPHKTFSPLSVIALITLFIGVEGLSTYLLLGANVIFPDVMEAYARQIDALGVANMTPLASFVALVIAPIGEELAFRGITFKYARRLTKNFWVANILQALMFGIAHLSLVQGTYAFIIGLLLGYIVKRYNSLWASIIGHLCFNFAGTYVVNWIFGDGLEITVAKFVIVLVAALLLAFHGFLGIKKDKKADVREEMYNKRVAMEWPEYRVFALDGPGSVAGNIENAPNDEGSPNEEN